MLYFCLSFEEDVYTIDSNWFKGVYHPIVREEERLKLIGLR